MYEENVPTGPMKLTPEMGLRILLAAHRMWEMSVTQPLTRFDQIYESYLLTLMRGIEVLQKDNKIEDLMELKESMTVLDKVIEKLMVDPATDLQIKNMFKIPKDIMDNVLSNCIVKHLN
jgi:hypothetical protein